MAECLQWGDWGQFSSRGDFLGKLQNAKKMKRDWDVFCTPFRRNYRSGADLFRY